jgi:adenylosuccinate lyase
LARLMRSYAMSAMENQALWHERDISHSSVERVILPDANILLYYMIQKTSSLIEKLLVYPAHMRENLEKTKGLIFSQTLLLALVAKGMSREDAYRVVQDLSMECWKTGAQFRDLVVKDSTVQKTLDPKSVDACFDLKVHLRNVDPVFKRAGLISV